MTEITCNDFEDLKREIRRLYEDDTQEAPLKLCSIKLTHDSEKIEIMDTSLRFFINRHHDTNYYNLEFVDLEKTTSSFNEVQELLSDNKIRNKQDWDTYPSIHLLHDESDGFFGKIQISDKDCLKINFSRYNDKLMTVLEILLKKYCTKNRHKTALAEHVLNIITKNQIDIYEETDCKYEDGFWDIALSNNCGFTYFYDKPKKNHYLNFRGFYLGNNSDDFTKTIKEELFGDDLEVKLKSSTRLDSDVADEICINFKSADGIFDSENNFMINFKNTDFFAIVFKDGQELISNSKIRQFIEYLLKRQKIKLGIPENSPTTQSVGFTIGLINEFAFPVDTLKEQIESILVDLGHQKNNIQLLDINNITSIDSSKVNIISNISSADNIESVGDETDNKAIFIACGLEHDLASVSKQKIVKEFKTRIQRDTNNPKESDYRNIGQNLATNEVLKKLRENINKCYYQADFFLTYERDKNSKLSKYKMKQQLKRFFNLLHGFPFATPTKDEYAMYMAFSSALRSADLSRQVGAVITTPNGDILATGANDIPKSGGGLYRAHLNDKNGNIYDDALGRDYMRGFDSNAIEKQQLINNIYDALQSYVDGDVDEIKSAIADSKLKDITEYGRVVHAEMDALMACARGHVSSDGAILYCTTFPCHNCAKHIIAAGIKRVVYIEPYAKSKALPFHFDSVVDEEENPIETLIKDKLRKIKGNYEFITNQSEKIRFESFVGVGPNLFRQLFKMQDNSRKNKDGTIKNWRPQLIDL